MQNNMTLRSAQLIIAIMVLGGCKSVPSNSSASSNGSNQQAEKTSSCQKVVTDSRKVVEGEGCKVKGINDWEGEISGVPAPGSKFAKLKIGMGLQEAMDIAGQPSDQGSHLTGKAFIPFYRGSDRSRVELVYEKQGRLIFATSWGSPGLIWIIHNPNEIRYR
jgi:hypothetical protein